MKKVAKVSINGYGFKCCIGSILMVCLKTNPEISGKDEFILNYLKTKCKYTLYEIPASDIDNTPIGVLEKRCFEQFIKDLDNHFDSNVHIEIYTYSIPKNLEFDRTRFTFIKSKKLTNFAFVLAKYLRGLSLEKYNVGTCYPNDPKTIEFIKLNPHEDIIRKKWKCCQI